MLESDRALLDAFRRGERAALTQVFRAYLDDVTATVRAGVVVASDSGQRTRVGTGMPEHEAEALIQETFARAFMDKARASYDGLRPYGAYLATIARNLVIDRERARRRDNIAPVEDLAVFAADERTDPGFRLEEKQFGAVVLSVKKRLGEPDLSIFRLRFEERESCRAIAAALGLSEIVVRRCDARLRRTLLRALQSTGFLEHALTTENDGQEDAVPPAASVHAKCAAFVRSGVRDQAVVRLEVAQVRHRRTHDLR